MSLLEQCNIEYLQDHSQLLQRLFGISVYGNDTMEGLACSLFHDEHFIKTWSKMFLLQAPYVNCSLFCSFPAHLFDRPPGEYGMRSPCDPRWANFTQRSKWFVEVYREMYHRDFKTGILQLIDGPIRNYCDYKVQSAARLLAILQIHETLTEKEHIQIIEHILRLELAKPHPVVLTDEPPPAETIAQFYLSFSKESCTNLIILLRPTAFDAIILSLKSLQESMLRFFEVRTPVLQFEGALIAVDMYHKDSMYYTLVKSNLYPLSKAFKFPKIARQWYEITINAYKKTNNGRTKFRLQTIQMMMNLLEAKQYVPIFIQKLEEIASIFLISKMTYDYRFYLRQRETIAVEALEKCWALRKDAPRFRMSMVRIHEERERLMQEVFQYT
jgi:hypothetical protein